MAKIIVFGGTTEGRQLACFLQSKQMSTLVCVATLYGEAQLEAISGIRVQVKRLNQKQMVSLFRDEQPRLVVDATHPYAAEVSQNIEAACRELGLNCIAINREQYDLQNCHSFADFSALIQWLNGTEGMIFAAIGTKGAADLTELREFRQRVYLRLLPNLTGLGACLNLGYDANKLICMQGPFSRELNAAMFRQTKSAILVTKESGDKGGFVEKLAAAEDCGMQVAVLTRPQQRPGLTLTAAKKMIGELIG
ncbi:MAG: precorrin-6A reductase [Clostridiales bacterium]